VSSASTGKENFEFCGGREKCRILESGIKSTNFFKQKQIVHFFMNEFFGTSNYEYLLEHIGENEPILMGTMWITGNSQERKMAPIS
jgi:hypothetical protein